ncbi:MAG: four helix bundle protein [Bacteroidales bacterium]
MGVSCFEELIAWKKARELNRQVFDLFNPIRDFGFKDQIQRAALSIMNNIAEGFDRHSQKEFRRFLLISRGSCGEVRSMLYLAQDFGYLSEDGYTMLNNLTQETGKLISGLIKSQAN